MNNLTYLQRIKKYEQDYLKTKEKAKEIHKKLNERNVRNLNIFYEDINSVDL